MTRKVSFLPPMPARQTDVWLTEMRGLMIDHLQSWLPRHTLELSIYEPEKWQQELTEFLGALLTEAPGCLPDIMYRIDVNEEKFRAVADNPEGETPAGRIARLILQREAEKTAWRMLYSTGNQKN